MNVIPASQLGNSAAKLLHEKLASVGLLNDLFPSVLATMPLPVQEAHASDPQLLPMFRATAGQYVMEFAWARLSMNSAPLFKKRVLGFFRLPDEMAWQKFTDGVMEYAVSVMTHPAIKGNIIEYINDRETAVKRFCKRYPVEAMPVLETAALQVEQLVGEVIKEIS